MDWMRQSVFTRNVLEKLGMANTKSMSTPADVSTKLVKGDDSDKVDKAEYLCFTSQREQDLTLLML